MTEVGYERNQFLKNGDNTLVQNRELVFTQIIPNLKIPRNFSCSIEKGMKISEHLMSKYYERTSNDLSAYTSEGLTEAAYFMQENYPRGLYQGNVEMLNDIGESSSSSFAFHVYLEVGLLALVCVVYLGYLMGLLFARRRQLMNEFQEISLLTMINNHHAVRSD